MSLIIDEFTFILNAIRLSQLSISVLFAVDPIAGVGETIRLREGTKSVNLIFKELTNKLAAVFPSEFTLTVHMIFLPVAFVDGLVLRVDVSTFTICSVVSVPALVN